MGCVAQAEGEEVIKRNALWIMLLDLRTYNLYNIIEEKLNESSYGTCEQKFSSFPKSYLEGASRQITIQEGQ